ncbi:hypothetical protein Rrhod_4372 [Rhodococcus rhodnii LMG 5362]|uniref:RES domain-containing protein n=2 Tax=Rhodococcus rhodnii TaxID=38312 RepID=R7WJQ4_9NOCA|nr:hypothetical protein Rrhod_4372 [Rhodococcus rhodnii LMG 5362]
MVGRFDLPAPLGTCYVAETEMIGLYEMLAGVRFVAEPDIASRTVSELTVDHDLIVADATANDGIRYGLTAEISTVVDYRLTQHWAKALQAAGFDGIRYWARHELAHEHACLALFESSGDNTVSVETPSDYRVSRTHRLTDRADLLDSLERHAGITVVAPPRTLGPL